jgi:hypothetical protein
MKVFRLNHEIHLLHPDAVVAAMRVWSRRSVPSRRFGNGKPETSVEHYIGFVHRAALSRTYRLRREVQLQA